MKYLTITVPSFNSEKYLERCLDSLVIGGEDVEIIVVDDGSTDRTGEIGERYAERFPGVVRVVHKENGGHGSGVNIGLRLASGQYFKVVDSDDWLEEHAYRELLRKIKDWCRPEGETEGWCRPQGETEGWRRTEGETECWRRPEGETEGWRRPEETGQANTGADLIICNYVYNHLDDGEQKAMSYRNVFPGGKICTWDDIGMFYPSQYLVMHALVYRTEALRRSGVVLPEHTFYVDNIFAYYPLPFMETLYYMDVDLYQYYLGREDQSVNEKVMIARIEQQIKVTKIVAECVDLDEVKRVHPKLANYMCRNVSIMMAISSIHLLLKGDEGAVQRHREIWMDMKRINPRLYFRLRYSTLSGLTNLPGRLGKRAAVDGYRIAKKIYKFQ